MAIVAVIVRIMPDSPEANLEEIKKEAQTLVESEGAKNISFEEQEIAFGLKAIMLKMAWAEAKDTSIFEDALAKIPHISSVQVTDYRRAFG